MNIMRWTPEMKRSSAPCAAAHTRVWFGVLLVVWAPLVSCDKPASGPASGVATPAARKTDGIYPFVPGARWVYHTEVAYPFTERIYYQVFTNIEATEMIDGKQYQRVVSVRVAKEGKTPTFALFRDSPEGVYKIDSAKPDKGEYLDTPRPLRVGVEWDINSPVCVYHCVVQGIETVNLTGGTYPDCWKIALRGRLRNENGENLEIRATVYRAAGIGEVKAVTNLETPTGLIVTTTELAMHAMATDSGNVIPNYGSNVSATVPAGN